jgi:DNA-binding GntR family transcriptional regulator
MPPMMKERGNLLYRRVYRTLRGRILSGEYEPGDRIETEHELTV